MGQKDTIQQTLERFVRVVCSSSYHPQSQGKCERANRTLKDKIRKATMRPAGFNRIEGLQELTSVINRT